MMRARIAILATLDTKAAEASFVADCLRSRGHTPLVVDVGTAGTPSATADITRDEVVSASGHAPTDLPGLPKDEAMSVVAAGAGALISRLIDAGDLDGIIGLGGGQGTWIAATAMRPLPIGFPKVMVTTIPHRTDRHVGGSDIAFFPSVTDMSGLNRIIRPVLANAAAAIAGMAEGVSYETPADRPLVGMTMFGVTTGGAEIARRHLDARGYDTAIFHANGIGGLTLENLAAAGRFVGVLDWTTTELIDEVAGGIATAGPRRLEAAGAAGIPQLVVPGAIDVVNFGPPSSVPERFGTRTLHGHTPAATLMRSNIEENRTLGSLMAEKLNAARGPVSILIPEHGFSALDREGGPFWDPDADAAFVDALESALETSIPITRLPLHINDQEFAETAADSLVSLIEDRSPQRAAAPAQNHTTGQHQGEQ